MKIYLTILTTLVFSVSLLLAINSFVIRKEATSIDSDFNFPLTPQLESIAEIEFTTTYSAQVGETLSLDLYTNSSNPTFLAYSKDGLATIPINMTNKFNKDGIIVTQYNPRSTEDPTSTVVGWDSLNEYNPDNKQIFIEFSRYLFSAEINTTFVKSLRLFRMVTE